MDEFRIWVERKEGDRFFDIDSVIKVTVQEGEDNKGGVVSLEEHQEEYSGHISGEELNKIKAYKPDIIEYEDKYAETAKEFWEELQKV